jgi:hypothetical protein
LGVVAPRLWAYACNMKTQALMVNAPHTSQTATDPARARRRFIKLMEHRFGPLPYRDKSRVMAASTAVLAAMEDRLVGVGVADALIQGDQGRAAGGAGPCSGAVMRALMPD